MLLVGKLVMENPVAPATREGAYRDEKASREGVARGIVRPVDPQDEAGESCPPPCGFIRLQMKGLVSALP